MADDLLYDDDDDDDYLYFDEFPYVEAVSRGHMLSFMHVTLSPH